MSIYWIQHSYIYMGLGTWKHSEHRLHIVSATSKNSEFSSFIWALGLGKIPRPRSLLGCGTRKNFKLSCLYIGFVQALVWDLEKFHAGASSQVLGLGKILSSASIQALGFEKMLSFPFLRLQPVGEAPSVVRCEVSLFCLLHISSKLFLLTYSSKSQKCECLSPPPSLLKKT